MYVVYVERIIAYTKKKLRELRKIFHGTFKGESGVRKFVQIVHLTSKLSAYTKYTRRDPTLHPNNKIEKNSGLVPIFKQIKMTPSK